MSGADEFAVNRRVDTGPQTPSWRGARLTSKPTSKTVEQAMSVRKLTASVLTALAIAAGAASVHAQGRHNVPPADPFAFDPDFQWFEPIYDMDLLDMKPKKRAATGWFGTYDRLNLYGTRPETEAPSISEESLDSGWGHRYEVGYMLPHDDTGWLFSWVSNNVNANDTIERESLMRYNGDQVIDGSGGGFPIAPPFGEIVTQREQNTQGFNNRFYFIDDSLNVMSLDSYELSKTWRLEPYHYGGMLEPMVGFRWLRLTDVQRQMNYQSTFDFVPLTLPGGFEGAAEQITKDEARTQNEMVAGQVGFRYFKFRDRFTFSTALRVFAGGNYQRSKSQTETTTYIYDFENNEVEVGAPLEAIFDDKTDPIYSHNDEFFVGLDVRGQIAYQLTKMFAIRGGFQVIDIETGVWRGGDGSVVAAGDHDQDVLLVGATFGVELNR